jgi:hypothetical protein
MADFCMQCSIDHFGEDFKDLAGLCSDKPDHVARVICEGCGNTIVDHTGKCIANCLERHLAKSQGLKIRKPHVHP